MMERMGRELPRIIKEVGFDFRWDERNVWKLNVPAEDLPIGELVWHFDVPFMWSKPDGYYDVKPRDAIAHPSRHSEEYERTMHSDASYPIGIIAFIIAFIPSHLEGPA